jgi:hypothetical protein
MLFSTPRRPKKEFLLWAELKASSDAYAVKAEAELRRQKVIVAIETARNAVVKQKAETDKLEAELVAKRQATP